MARSIQIGDSSTDWDEIPPGWCWIERKSPTINDNSYVIKDVDEGLLDIDDFTYHEDGNEYLEGAYDIYPCPRPTKLEFQ